MRWRALAGMALLGVVVLAAAGPSRLQPPAADEKENDHQYQCTDVWQSGYTDLPDLAFFAQHYNACAGDPRFDGRADFDGDGCTDTVDFAIFKKYFRNRTPNEENPYCSLPSGAYNCPDILNDGTVDIRDFSLFARHYNKCSPDPGYDASTDFDLDGCTDEIDYTIFAKAFHNPGWTYYCETPA